MNKRSSILCTVLCLLVFLAQAQVKYDMYYFAVGSGHYEKDFDILEEGFAGLTDERAAIESAHRVASLFDEMGAIEGEVLVSEEFKFITRKKLFSGLKRALKAAKKSKAENPFFIFYYCGHGFTNGTLQAMFIPPGDLAKDVKKFDYEAWLENTISPVEIREVIEESGLPYMIIMDCCHEGDIKPMELLNPDLVQLLEVEQLDGLMKASYGMVIGMNRMIGPDPTLFSTLSGNVVRTVNYPFQDGEVMVGPLCYRMYKTYGNLKNGEFTLENFMAMMQSAKLDVITAPAVSYWKSDDTAQNYFKK